MKLSNAEFDIFVEYITQKLLYYQNELFKQEVISYTIFINFTILTN